MIGANFDTPPEEAIAYFNSLGVTPTFSWDEVAKDSTKNSFTIAKLASLDVLQDTRDALEDALQNGIPYSQFKKDFKKVLNSHGWDGVKEIADSSGAITGVKFDDPWRMRTIYRTNMQSAYSAGHYKTQVETADVFPYWEYDAVGDRRTRPSHLELDGAVFRADDPFWDTFYPPNGFNCRCTVNTLTEDDVQASGVVVQTGAGKITTEEHVASNGTTSSFSVYTNDKGVSTKTDNGWNYNVGQSFYEPDFSNYTPALVTSVFRVVQQELFDEDGELL